MTNGRTDERTEGDIEALERELGLKNPTITVLI